MMMMVVVPMDCVAKVVVGRIPSLLTIGSKRIFAIGPASKKPGHNSHCSHATDKEEIDCDCVGHIPARLEIFTPLTSGDEAMANPPIR